MSEAPHRISRLLRSSLEQLRAYADGGLPAGPPAVPEVPAA